jgi:hypothetical protein
VLEQVAHLLVEELLEQTVHFLFVVVQLFILLKVVVMPDQLVAECLLEVPEVQVVALEKDVVPVVLQHNQLKPVLVEH